MATWLNDPLLVKEFRTRLRARTVLIVEILYVCGLCGATILTMLAHGRDAPAWETGQALFATLTYTQAMMLLFVTPLVAASTVSAEKEQRTFDSLMVTPVSARRVIFAKLAAVLGVFAMLLAVSFPFAAASFILGGVDPAMLVIAWLYTFLMTAAMGALGVYWSTCFERSIASIPAAAVCAVLVGIVLPVFAEDGAMTIGLCAPSLFIAWLFKGRDAVWYGLHLPLWLPAFLMLAVVLTGCTAAAVQRLKFTPERRYLLTRALALALWLLLALGLMGESTVTPEHPSAARETMSRALGLLLAGLLAAAPWVGASTPVIRSEWGRPYVRTRRRAFLAAALAHPLGFTATLWGAGCVAAGLLWAHVGTLNVPAGGMFAVALTALLAPASWSLLAFRLADRRTGAGRAIGLTVAYVLILVLTVVPMAAVTSSAPDLAASAASPSLLREVAGLASPFALIALVSSPANAVREFAALSHTLGPAAVWWVSALLHGALLLLLAVPIYPSETRRQRRGAALTSSDKESNT